jgi:hypothetical protein
MLADRAFTVSWITMVGERLTLHANLGADPVSLADHPLGRVLFRHAGEDVNDPAAALPAGSVVLSIETGDQGGTAG